MFAYLKSNLLAGYKVCPLRKAGLTFLLTGIFACIAVPVGFSSDLFCLQILDSDILYILPFSLFIFPAFLEESFFRGILIPNNAKEKSLKYILCLTMLSAALFTLWHPLNALTVNPGAKELFLNSYFLGIVFALGIINSLSYIFSQSLWAPIFIHWFTVLIWVIFLGGRNLILA
jgi:uncharacterized protein